MKKIIDELINHSIKGVDVYRHKDATWLIFSEQNRWVVELTDNGTLWYNYNFFSDILRYVSLECGGESNDYITGWANDYFSDGVNKTQENDLLVEWHTLKVINEGVKEVRDSSSYRVQNRAENLVWRIVKHVKPNIVYSEQSGAYDPDCDGNHLQEIYRIIEEGIKNTYPDRNSGEYDWSNEFEADKVIEIGVKL